MPAESKQASSELDDLAFKIYSQRVAVQYGRRGGEQLAIDSYRRAEAFVAVRDRYRNGELEIEKTTGPVLADCCAPNLKRTHPFNLVSQRLGDLPKVNRIKAWLDKNPTPERDPEELVAKLNREFPELSWDQPTINTARQIFPAYVGSPS